MSKITEEDIFAVYLDSINVPYERQFMIKPHRYRYDFFLPQHDIIIEIEGGLFKFKRDGKLVQGGHTHPMTFIKDCHKYLHAQRHGYRVIRIPTQWLSDKPRTPKLPKSVYRFKELKGVLTNIFLGVEHEVDDL